LKFKTPNTIPFNITSRQKKWNKYALKKKGKKQKFV
jgi:hypothetical protein